MCEHIYINVYVCIEYNTDAEEVSALRKLENARAIVSKEYEFTEQKDTIAKYELSEMKKTHEDLSHSITEMKKENGSSVTPVLEKLKQDVRKHYMYI
jgi:DNA-binding Lrp family transcriptional regulator